MIARNNSNQELRENKLVASQQKFLPNLNSTSNPSTKNHRNGV